MGTSSERERPERPLAGFLLIERLALAYRRADSRLRRFDRASRSFVSALLNGSLSNAEKSRLSFRLYDADLGRDTDPGSLFDWERRWLERELPAPPARVLVGGAGAGREVRALVQKGYRVDALEPAPAAAALCRRHVDGDGRVVVGDYAALSRGDTVLSSRRYDAVLLGWGSLTHVLTAGEQEALLEACGRLTPEGPILASFWIRQEHEPTGRAHAFGAKTGALLARLRGGEVEASSHLFVPWGGFNAPRTVQEIEALAGAIGRQLRWDRETGGFPRAAFLASPS